MWIWVFMPVRRLHLLYILPHCFDHSKRATSDKYVSLQFLCCYIAPIDILLNHLFQKNHKKRCPRNSVIYRLCQKHIPKNCCKDIKKSYAELYSWGECHIGNKNSSPDMKILYVQSNKYPYFFRQEPLVITFSSSESSSVWPWREEINQLTQGVFNLFLGQETQGGD